MKTLLIVITIVVVMFGAIHLIDGTPNEYVKENTMEVVEEPKEAWMTDEDAVKAAQDVIKRKQAEQELDTVQADIEALKASFKVEMELLKSQEDELTEELSFQ